MAVGAGFFVLFVAVFLEEGEEVLEGGGGFEIRESEAERCFEGGDELHLLEAAIGGELVNGVYLGEGAELGGDEGLAVGCRAADEVLGQTDQVVEAGVCVVELACGEFGIVSLVDAFVSEGRTELKDLVDAPYHETLEPEFWSDAHREGFSCCPGAAAFKAGHERSGDGPSGVLGQDGGLELEEASLVEEVTDVSDDVGAQSQGIYGPAVCKQVYVSIVEAQILVQDLEW